MKVAQIPRQVDGNFDAATVEDNLLPALAGNVDDMLNAVDIRSKKRQQQPQQ